MTQKVFDQLKVRKPRYLFVAADGPRLDKPEDVQKCEATRRIFDQIDWPCELKTLFQTTNRGCGYGPAEAITWFFEHVEQGIILEDDCLPDQSFFPFCEELLERYAQDKRVVMISGTNPFVKWKKGANSYIFSNLGFSWGWATWRSAWQDFDYKATRWFSDDGKARVRRMLKNDACFTHYSNSFDHYFSEPRNDIWDYQWLFCRYWQGGCSIVPTLNLITNIGFGNDSTHTVNSQINMAHLATERLHFPLNHSNVKVDEFYDWYLFERYINPKERSFWKKGILKSIKLMTKLY